jgi:hypothetical protein
MMDANERALFADAVRRATEAASGPALDAALGELGWADALTADAATAVAVLFEAQGTADATSSALDLVVMASLGLSDTGVAAVLPALRSTAPPGRLHHGRLSVEGLATASAARAARILFVAAEPEAGAWTVAPEALALRPVRGLDPALGLVEVHGELDLADAEPLATPGPLDWTGAVAAGQRALGHELLGASRRMLELARVHALERVQFGRPIATFQAVRHRLAESYVAIEGAAALLAVAWEEPSPATAALAKGMAGRSARTVARHAQQVLAGIGFTTEHGLHRSVRRTLVLDQLLGAGSVLTRRSGTDLLTRGVLPAAVPL